MIKAAQQLPMGARPRNDALDSLSRPQRQGLSQQHGSRMTLPEQSVRTLRMFNRNVYYLIQAEAFGKAALVAAEMGSHDVARALSKASANLQRFVLDPEVEEAPKPRHAKGSGPETQPIPKIDSSHHSHGLSGHPGPVLGSPDTPRRQGLDDRSPGQDTGAQ